jgi:phospholipase C
VAEIVNALMASSAWQSSVFILTYDEFGGYYDHVPPRNVPAPDTIAPMETPGVEALLPGDFVHSGFRLPLIVFSPWVKPHFVSHVPRDSTSWLKLVEVRFGLPALTARDAAADDMTEFFDFTTPTWLVPPPLPVQPTNGACDFTRELLGQN